MITTAMSTPPGRCYYGRPYRSQIKSDRPGKIPDGLSDHSHGVVSAALPIAGGGLTWTALEATVSAQIDVFEAMSTARSIRRFTAAPVDPDLVDQVLWAGTRASNPNNTQAWDFVVVTAPEVRRTLGDAFARSIGATSSGSGDAPGPAHLPEDPSKRRTTVEAMDLLGNFHAVPVIIFVCVANVYPAGNPVLEWAYSAMHCAAQNMLVAARALGLGAAFTTFHRQAEPEIRDVLAIPDDRIIGVTMPMGWPAGPFGAVRRRPMSEVVHRDTWTS
jgi:nitroreductase